MLKKYQSGGAFNFSSSPLTTLMPQTSPYQIPDYANAFKTNTLPMMDKMKLQVGLATLDSSDFMTALKGKSMVNDAINGTDNTSLLSGTKTSSSSPFNLSNGFSALSLIGGKVGGLAGAVLSGVGNIGTNIQRISEAGKAAKTASSLGDAAGLSAAKGAKAGAIGGVIGAASDMLGSFLPQKTEYAGPKGDITLTMDSVYDGISDAAMSMGPYGMLVGGIMKGGALLGKGMNALGGGTDGMCVCAGTKVYTATGAIINIEDLLQEQGIIGWNQTTKEIVPLTIHSIIEPRLKECLEITLKSGHILRCSIDHPILSDNSPKAKSKTINGKRVAIRPWQFRRADELKVGDFVGLANNIDYWGDKEVPKAYLIGMLIGDGSYTKESSCRIISADPETWDYLEKNNLGVINHCDDSRPEKYKTEVRTYRIIDGMDLMRSVGLVYLSGKNKTLPKNLGEWDKLSVCQLMAGLFDTDGSISVNADKGQYSITLYLSNKPLLEEVKLQLHKLGIFSTIGERKAAKYELGGKVINSNISYRLEVHDIASARKFYELIHLNISRKQDNLELIFNMLASKAPLEHSDISGAKLSKIVSIEAIGVLTVYNLLADNDHTYLANGIITHNTTTDAILGSSFLNLTPIGLVNGFGGKKADTITKDNQAFETVGASYTGSNQTVNDALLKSGKKYGLFSSGARKKANLEIAEAKRQQNVIADIADEAVDRNTIKYAMSAINGNRRAFNMLGGYDLSAVRVGRHGMSLEKLNAAMKIVKALKGTKVKGNRTKSNRFIEKPEYSEWLKTVPLDRLNDNYDLETAYKYLPLDVLENWRMSSKEDLQNGKNHLYSIAPIDGTEDYIFLKKGVNEKDAPNYNPELHFETDTYYDGSNGLKETHDLVYEGDRYYYRKKKSSTATGENAAWGETTPEFKEGGSIALTNPTTITEEDDSIIELLDPATITEEDIEEFKEGGSINVIPDGALHARLHHMENDEDITKKGIPVVDNDGEQQAEVEKEEIIFRLEVTKKLEELEKKYDSEETSQKEKDELALEAGKLLTEEILHNTLDNTNNLL